MLHSMDVPPVVMFIVVVIAMSSVAMLFACSDPDSTDSTGGTADSGNEAVEEAVVQQQAGPVGTWVLDIPATLDKVRELRDLSENDYDRNEFEGLLEVIPEMSSTLTLNEDGSATMTIVPEEGAGPSTVTWTLDGEAFVLTTVYVESGVTVVLNSRFTGDTIMLGLPEVDGLYMWVYKRE